MAKGVIMNKYYIEILVEKWNHAGTKARTDVALFLDDMQVRNLVFDKEVGRIEKFLFTKRNIRKKLNVANPGDMVVVSHRIFFEKADEDYLLKIIKDKHLKSVLLIHDVESLRQDYNQDQTAEEIKLMNLYDIIISHNASMTKWLKANGVTSHIINLELFDYFSLTPIKKSYEKDKGIIFAGNLEKSVFLTKLNNPKNKISLYGPSTIK
ncbi:hypothetical protein OC195_19995 [Priestia flexa]|nr:hypothetical protein OC195_19995 [Priestia flexa]